MADQDLPAPAVSEDFVSRCLKYMKAEDVAEDPNELALVQDLILSAREYLDAAGVRRLEETSARYDLLVCAMVLHEYDHRDDAQASAAYPPAVRLKINQLKIDCQLFP